MHWRLATQCGRDPADLRMPWICGHPDMLETWSAAVQSATKASLAKVAGDAALAFDGRIGPS